MNAQQKVLSLILATCLCLAGYVRPAGLSAAEVPLSNAPVRSLPSKPTDETDFAGDDAWVHVREAQRLLKLGRTEDGTREADKAKKMFLNLNERPAWVVLETITAGKVMIEAQMNLLEDVAKPPEIGIVRPFSFRILTQAPEDRLVETIDFEIGFVDGKPNTAALGRTTASQHVNFGSLPPDSDYKAIREKVLQLSQARHARVELPPKAKQFLNISLPVGSQFTPLILSASSNQTIVARVCIVDGRRDIQVIENSGGEWKPVGMNGDGITGVDGNFLEGATTGPDGRVWIMAAYTRPSNNERGETHYLYVYDGTRWKLAGPGKGYPSGTMGDFGINFLGNTLVHHFLGYDRETKRNKPYWLYLDDTEWKPVSAQSLLRRQEGDLVWTGSNAYYFVCSERDGRTAVNAYTINGFTEKDVSGPYPVAVAPGTEFVFRKFAVSQDGNAAVILKSSEQDNPRWFCCLVRGIGKGSNRDVLMLPPPPIKYYPTTLMWSPVGYLAITDLPLDNTVTIYVLRDSQWTKMAEASQPLEAGRIFNHSLSFTAEGVPILTWQDFFPH